MIAMYYYRHDVHHPPHRDGNSNQCQKNDAEPNCPLPPNSELHTYYYVWLVSSLSKITQKPIWDVSCFSVDFLAHNKAQTAVDAIGRWLHSSPEECHRPWTAAASICALPFAY
jgi:hypothetical protein